MEIQPISMKIYNKYSSPRRRVVLRLRRCVKCTLFQMLHKVPVVCFGHLDLFLRESNAGGGGAGPSRSTNAHVVEEEEEKTRIK